MESFVAVMALCAASILEPGVYFAMNSPAAIVGTTPESAAAAVTAMGFPIDAAVITQTALDVGESTIISRTGGAPTLAVGMAHVFAGAVGGRAMQAFWYHFAILFEALFILTACDAGTRAGRFMLQDLVGTVVPSFRRTSSWTPAIASTAIVVGSWGYFLYQGVTDPLGGINTLWPLFGMANQMLAAIALTLATVVVFKMKREQYAWVTGVPLTWLMVCTLTAAYQKLFSGDPTIGFVAHAHVLEAALQRGEVLAPAHSLPEMRRIVTSDHVNAGMSLAFALIVIAIFAFGALSCWRALRRKEWTALEIPSLAVTDDELARDRARLAGGGVTRCC
jgi:carbon starvation protein